MKNYFKKFFLFNVKGFDINKICACTILYEGTVKEVAYQQQHINSIASKFGGLNAGSEGGMKGYFLTFVIAYVRDFCAQHCYVAESFETSCPWSKVSSLCSNVKERAYKSCKSHGILENRLFVSFRVT
jgi:alkyldihydroxyacetonephosphate synthase